MLSYAGSDTIFSVSSLHTHSPVLCPIRVACSCIYAYIYIAADSGGDGTDASWNSQDSNNLTSESDTYTDNEEEDQLES